MLEADLQRHYRVELTALWRGELTLRRLRVLIEHLPPDSASAHAVAGFDGALASWSLTDVLLGRVSDELAALRWQWESAHLQKGKRPRKAPESVLPRAEQKSDPESIPVVSPHSLGTFVYDNERSAS